MTATSPRPAVAGPLSLVEAVAAGVDALTNLATLSAVVSSGRVEALLREALAEDELRHTARRLDEAGNPPAASDLAAAAVRAACAHLATSSFEDAYLALLTATDHLNPGQHRR